MTYEEIKGEMLLTEIEMSKLAQVFPEGFTGRVGLLIAKAQHQKDMNFPISKGEVCPKCKGLKGYHRTFPSTSWDTCPKCNGTGIVDITVGDAIERINKE